MKAQAGKKTFSTDSSVGRWTIIGGIMIGAGVLGIAVVTGGGSSGSQTLALGSAALIVIAGIAGIALKLPLITLVRWAFIASFFFKGEINFYKINEIEDPSGFNISLTLMTALILLIYDRFTESATAAEKIFPAAFSFLTLSLFGCAAISVFYGGSATLGWFSLWSFATSVLIAFVIASHFSRRDRLVQLVIGIAIGLLFTGLVALSQYAFDFPTDAAFLGTGTEDELLGTQSIALSRVPAFLRTPTEMAWVVSTLLPLVVAPVVCRVKNVVSRQNLILLAGAFSGIVAVILSLARGSWISLLAAVTTIVLLGWLRLSKTERKNYLVTVAGGLILSGLFLSPFAVKIYDRLTLDDQGSALIRVPLMETAVRMIQGNPLVGVGLNEYRTAMTKYDETGIFVSQIFPNPVHNVFAHITAEIGIPGGLIFCLLFIAALIECWRSMTAPDRLLSALALGCAAGIIAFVISAMKEPGSLGSTRPPLRTCFFLFGTILAVSRIRRRLLY